MLTEADKKLIKKFEHTCSDARIGDVADLLSIIDRQSKALVRCRQQRGVCSDTKEHYCRYQLQDKELELIMQGGGE